MYKEYTNGIPISEIVRKTGINRKAWNQRFSRLERKNAATNSNSEINQADEDKNVTTQNGDNSVIVEPNVFNNIGSQNRTNKCLAILAAIGFMLAIYLIYVEIKKRRNNSVEPATN